MTDTGWRARITAPGAEGSGFLVDDHHVVTCAHVVRGHSAVEVTIDGTRSLAGTVLRSGEWWSETADEADVAVIELAIPADVEPARLAPITALSLYPGEEISAYAVVRDWPEGVNVTFTANPARTIGTNIQVEPRDNPNVWIQKGFSGAAACRENATVVGMVKASAAAQKVGVMIPVGKLVRNCPKLDDLLPLGLLGPSAYQELRRTIEASRLSSHRVAQLRNALKLMVPGLPDHLDSLHALVEALVVLTSHESQQQMEYHLAGLLTVLGTSEAHGWGNQHLWEGLVAPTPEEDSATDRQPEVQTIIETIESALPEQPPPVASIRAAPPDTFARHALLVRGSGATPAFLGFPVDKDTVFVPREAVHQSPVQLRTADGDLVAADVLAIPDGETAVLSPRRPLPGVQPIRWGRLVVRGAEVEGDVLRLQGADSWPVVTTGTVRGSHDRRERYWLGPDSLPAGPGSPVMSAGRCLGFVAGDGQSVIPAAVAAQQAWEAGALSSRPVPDAIEFLDHEMPLRLPVTASAQADATFADLREWTAGVGADIRELEQAEAGALVPFLQRLRGSGWTVLEMTPAEVTDHWPRIRTAIGNLMITVDATGNDIGSLPSISDANSPPGTSVLRLLVLT